MKPFSEQLQKNRKGARGFTLVEILIVVALIVILLAVSVAGLMKLRKNIRQRELDSKAEIIYMAAQHRLTALKTGGFQELYTPEGNSDVVKRTGRPFDAADDNDQADKVCYVKSSSGDGHILENSGAASILPVSSVDRQLWDNHWVIEFCPETGTVYAVFYSEEPIQEEGEEALELRLDGLRVKQLRLDDGARIGYYGGDLTSITLSDALVPDIVVENAEKLKVTFSCRVPKPMKLKFTIYIYDENNEPNWNNLASEQEQKKVCIKKVTPTISSAASYKHEWILDSLDPNEGSFYQNTEGKIPAGANICIKLKVEEDTEGSLIAPKSITVTDNGIFAYKQDGKKNTAYIAYGRHLQNLHPGISMLGEKVKGGPGVEITSAIQVGDISFMENEADPDCFYNLYTAKNIGFVPIVNNTLVSYAGEKITEGGKKIVPAIQGLTIDSKASYVGLFGSYRGTIKDLMMTGTRITGRNGAFAGTLIGIASGDTTIDNVQVFLSQRLGDLVGAGLAPTQERDPEAVKPWVEGRIVGGLVGAYTTGKGLNIVNSSASTVLSGSKYAGGLVGAVSGPTYIDGSYADCYLKAEKTGGLIGTTGPGVALTMYNFYAVGYQAATRAAAGLTTYGDEQANYYPVQMYNGYAACQIRRKQEDTKVYNTVKNSSYVSARCVVYLSQDLYDKTVEGTRSVSYQELASDAIFQPTDSSGNNQPHLVYGKFTRQTTDIDNSSNPYNLMNQGLINYSYPRLHNMRHYGDWNAEFENGALVYFEYNGETAASRKYNFEGGNIYVNNIRRDDTQLNYKDRALVNGDGYALAFSGEQAVDKLQVSYNGNQVELGKPISVGNYKLFPLDPNLVNREDLLGDSFYQKLTVQYPVIDLTGTTTDTQIEKEDTFYFNPHFAKCIGASQTDVPDVVRVRSPRHLYALSKLFEKYQPLLKGSHSMISQDTDLDYGS
ncbi:MAG: prepilin-type N-terminal cleavage/methylation domain-containing protein, partial [Candidatus Faecousia sp.]|nr:prepilin-type N-terminal cleavage/methylation domain-containing protein [Candidatus Faecousia sp.]